ncbi:MAG TPA: metallophosphoesterase family protein [Rhodocyclaceae bacterium]|nr:metallophosphoesterase family protein [Rhodocyclaceae bacterium]
MRICIVSDSHDDGASLARCISSARSAGAVAAIHCGDVIGTNTLRAAMAVGLPLHVIHGNNLGDPGSLHRLAAKSEGLLTYHGQDATLTLHGRRIFVVHYPHYGRGMALTGDYDLVCCGHSHEPFVSRESNVRGGTTWLVNPGTTAGLGAPAATWILADLSAMLFEIHPV